METADKVEKEAVTFYTKSELKEVITKRGEKEGRNLSAQITYMLETYLREHEANS